MFTTEYEFTLPKGFVDVEGNLHQHGVMRLATAADEILPLKDPRVEKNAAYFVVILLSRVITKLGDNQQINPKIIEGLFAEDFSFLEDFYNRINGYKDKGTVACPSCEHEFEWESNGVGGS
jgi:hypothetical protein